MNMCSMNILFFFGVHFLSPNPHLRRVQGGGGGPKHTPLFQSPDGFLARLSCGVLSQPPSHVGSFLPFRSSPRHSDFSNRIKGAAGHPTATVWCNWEGKPHSRAGPLPSIESVASGQHYANSLQLSFRNPNHVVSGNLRNHLSAWETILQGHPKADELYGYLSS